MDRFGWFTLVMFVVMVALLVLMPMVAQASDGDVVSGTVLGAVAGALECGGSRCACWKPFQPQFTRHPDGTVTSRCIYGWRPG